MPIEPNSYAKLSKEDRAKKTLEITSFWKPKLSATPFKDVLILPKQQYFNSSDADQKGIYCYGNELQKGDIIMEIVDNNYSPLETKRRLHVLKKNPNFKDDYHFTGNYDSYIVPVSALSVCVTDKASAEPTLASISDKDTEASSDMIFSLEDTNKPDCWFSELTARDIFAILHKSPVSNKSWINDMLTLKV